MKKLFVIFISVFFLFNCSKIIALLDRVETNWDREFIKIDEQMKPAQKVYEDAVACAKEKINYYTDGKNEVGNYILNSNFTELNEKTQKDFIEIFEISIRADSVARPLYEGWITLKEKQNKTKEDIEKAKTYLQKLNEAKEWLKVILDLAKGFIKKI